MNDEKPVSEEAEALRAEIQKLKEIEALKAELAAMKGTEKKSGSEAAPIVAKESAPDKGVQTPKKRTAKDGCLLVLTGFIFFIIFMAIAGGVLSSIFGDTKKTDASATPSMPAAVTPSTTLVEDKTKSAPLDSLPQLTSGALCRAYEANEIAADEQFKGKEVIVIGPMKNITKDTFGDGAMVSMGEEFLGVAAGFSAEEAKKLSSLHKGQRIAVRGIVTGKLLGIHMKDCVLVKITHRES